MYKNPYSDIQPLTTDELLDFFRLVAERQFWTEFNARSRLRLVQVEGIIKPGTTLYRNIYFGCLDNHLPIVYNEQFQDELLALQGQRICIEGIVNIQYRKTNNSNMLQLCVQLNRILNTCNKEEDIQLQEAVQAATLKLNTRKFTRKTETPHELFSRALANAFKEPPYAKCRIAVIQPKTEIFRDVEQGILTKCQPDMSLAKLDTLISFEKHYTNISDPVEVARAFKELSQEAEQFHGIAVVRGGGDNIETVFEDPGVLDALAACPLPVVSALGHMDSHTTFDHFADKSFPTPTAFGNWLGDVFNEQKARFAEISKLKSEIERNQKAIEDLKKAKNEQSGELNQLKNSDKERRQGNLRLIELTRDNSKLNATVEDLKQKIKDEANQKKDWSEKLTRNAEEIERLQKEQQELQDATLALNEKLNVKETELQRQKTKTASAQRTAIFAGLGGAILASFFWQFFVR